MSPNTTEISPLAELALSSIPKIPSVSRLPKTFLMAYGLILKTTITNIINVLLKILIISPPCPFGPTTTVCFWFSPNLPHVLGVYTSLVTTFLHPIKSTIHVFHHKMYPLNHMCHGLYLELKFSLGRGRWYKRYPHVARVTFKHS